MIEDFKFKDKILLTDKTVELFKRFEFKSLVPTHLQDEIKNFKKLGKNIMEITKEDELPGILSKILKA
jgi:fructose-specific phosphotransferase system component IIB